MGIAWARQHVVRTRAESAAWCSGPAWWVARCSSHRAARVAVVWVATGQRVGGAVCLMISPARGLLSTRQDRQTCKGYCSTIELRESHGHCINACTLYHVAACTLYHVAARYTQTRHIAALHGKCGVNFFILDSRHCRTSRRQPHFLLLYGGLPYK